MNRGDVVTVDFSLYDPADKVRPALVIQNDRDNGRMTKTIVALITTNIRRAGEDTQYVMERGHPDFPASGLYRDSAVNCSNLYTIRQADVSRVIGKLTQATMKEIDACLRAVLGLA
jgi:mRNA-degrading endonuclease toxin of MazEF toxin-antitoxin module